MADKAKITDTPSGPVAHVEPGESLDMTEKVEVDPTRVGSTPRTDPEPALVDKSAEEDLVAEGDTRKAGHVSEVDKPDEVLPTNAELRKAGYKVPEDAKAGDVPSAYTADSPTPPGEVHLVVKPEEDPDAHLTPNERFDKASKAVSKAPKNK